MHFLLSGGRRGTDGRFPKEVPALGVWRSLEVGRSLEIEQHRRRTRRKGDFK